MKQYSNTSLKNDAYEKKGWNAPLYSVLLFFALTFSLVLRGETPNTKENELIKGHVITEMVLTREYKTNYFEIMIGNGSYLISLLDQNTNTVAESFSKNNETLTTWTAPAGIGISNNVPRFESVFCNGKTPLYSDPIIIEIWLAFCGNKESISNLLSQVDPEVMFPYLKQGVYNWPEFSYETSYGGYKGEFLKELGIKSPSSRLIEREKLLKAGLSREDIDTYAVSTDGRIIFPIDGGFVDGFFLFKLESFFSENDPYPLKTEVLRYRTPKGGTQQITSRFLICRDEVIRTSQKPRMPVLMKGRNSIRDYRFANPTNQPIFYTTKECWPFKDSTNYVAIRQMAENVMFALANEKKVDQHNFVFIIGIFVLVMGAPFFVLFVKKFKKE